MVAGSGRTIANNKELGRTLLLCLKSALRLMRSPGSWMLVWWIRHRDSECDLDIRARGSQCETIEKGVVGVVVGAQEETLL
jgi:hypothetical protein